MLYLLLVHGAALPFRLQSVDLLKKLIVDLEEEGDSLLLSRLCAGRLW
jgi:hypothetical protein